MVGSLSDLWLEVGRSLARPAAHPRLEQLRPALDPARVGNALVRHSLPSTRTLQGGGEVTSTSTF